MPRKPKPATPSSSAADVPGELDLLDAIRIARQVLLSLAGDPEANARSIATILNALNGLVRTQQAGRGNDSAVERDILAAAEEVVSEFDQEALRSAESSPDPRAAAPARDIARDR